MAEEQSSLQIDNDWKKQAQEEKRRLAEKAQEAKAAAPAAGSATAAATGATAGRRGAQDRETPPASFGTLVQQMMTQAMFYLGAIAYRGQPPMTDLDMARHQHDLLTMLEEKTTNNLTEEEKRSLDTALHSIRTRFIDAASEYLNY